MWNNEAGFGQGGSGGFVAGGTDGFNSPTQGASPGPPKKERRSQNLFPTTIQTILKCGSDGLIIDGIEVQMVTITGVIRSLDITSIKASYTIDDCTGVLEAIQWTDNDSERKDLGQHSLMELTYCRVVGSIRTQQGKKHIMIFNITPITDFNWITKHLAEVIHITLKTKYIQDAKANGGVGGQPGGTFAASISGKPIAAASNNVYASNDAGSEGLTNPQRLVFQLIQQCKDDCGIGRKEVYTRLQGKLAPKDMDNALDFLSSEGHIYTTIDDDTFRTTDS